MFLNILVPGTLFQVQEYFLEDVLKWYAIIYINKTAYFILF